MRKLIRVLILVLSLAAFLGIILARPTTADEAAASNVTTFSLLRTDSKAQLKKGRELDLGIRMTNNNQRLLTFEFAVSYDAAHFDFAGYEKQIQGLAVELGRQSSEESGHLIFVAWTQTALTSESATLLSLKLKSKVGETDTDILFAVTSIGIEDNLGSFGVYKLGLNTVSFTKTSIPWWIWLVLGGGILITLVGGYLMMLFFGAVINRFIQRTSKKIAEGSKKLAAKTRDLAKGMFNRRPQAPKLKVSNAKTSPVQSSGSKPNAKPNSSIEKSTTSAKEQKNVTTVKTRMVNPDGSVTTITKKIVDDEPQNKKEL
jgi:hypothetical protein